MTASPTPTPTPRTALIIVNYGSSDLLAAHFADVSADWLRVIVVDNFSSDAEQSSVVALAQAQGWDVVVRPTNTGFGGGVNAGAHLALQHGDEVIMTVNPDAQIDAATARVLATSAAADPSALVSPLIKTSQGRTWFAGADLYLDDGSTAGSHRRPERAGRPRREWATGACFAISAGLWRRIGGFDEDYFLYWEDVDLSHRVLDAGGSLVLRDDVTVVHDEGQTHGRPAGQRAKSSTYYYFNIRNRLVYAAKHLEAEDRRRWQRTSLLVSYRILLHGGRRQLVTSLGPWRALARGLRDGHAVLRRADV